MDEYEPMKVLGEGSYGKVYLMKSKTTRDLVCTKVIKLKNIPKKEQEACRNEVELLRRMVHPNIVGYMDSFLYKNCLCIIMEYCDAGDLGERVAKAKGVLFPETKIMTWFVQIAMGLHFMHSNRVLHRDIKTQNIFILGSGRVVLGDLGISKVMGGTADFASTQVHYAILYSMLMYSKDKVFVQFKKCYCQHCSSVH
jgi:NIMA (never in mitosis gene a)-related kinase 1/4/5